MLDDLKSLGIEELERRAREADTHIRALNFDESEAAIKAREELIRQQTLLNEARAELLKDEDLPPDVVVGMKPAFLRPKIQKPNRPSGANALPIQLEQTLS